MKRLKQIVHVVFVLFMVALIAVVVSMQFYPKETSQFIGYRFYTVLTDSMEPTIPTFSLIFTKVVDPEKELNLEKGDIITFEADRFGEQVLITHRFNQLQQNEAGEWCYRTNAEGKDNLDAYETHREHIVGTYIFHIPFLGKLFLFLKSPFGFIMYGEFLVIFLIKRLVLARWEEKGIDDEIHFFKKKKKSKDDHQQ